MRFVGLCKETNSMMIQRHVVPRGSPGMSLQSKGFDVKIRFKNTAMTSLSRFHLAARVRCETRDERFGYIQTRDFISPDCLLQIFSLLLFICHITILRRVVIQEKYITLGVINVIALVFEYEYLGYVSAVWKELKYN